MGGSLPREPRLGVLLVNDSPTQRAALRIALAQEPDVEVVGECADGYAATAAVARLRPSVVLLDVVMPGMDGFATAREIMARTPTPIVMISSAVDARDAGVILEAMRSRALAITQALPSPDDPTYGQRRGTLMQLLRSMAKVRVAPGQLGAASTPLPPPTRRPSPLATPAARAVRAPPAAPARVAAIGVVASAGGPGVVAEILGALPRGGMPPILIVQHIAPGFAVSFASWLTERTGYPTAIATQGAALEPGRAYVAPDDRHLGVGGNGRLLALSDAPPVGLFRPSGNWLLRSLAHSFGARALGVILSGMGDDGAEGAVELRREGGGVVVQDQGSAVVFSMPSAAIARDGVDAVLPTSGIAGWLCKRAGVEYEGS